MGRAAAQQRATWEVGVITAEAAQRHLEARSSKANEDRRAAETQCAAVRRDKDRLAARVKALEQDLAAARRLPGGRAPGEVAEGEPESPAADRGVEAPNAAGAQFLFAGAQAWHAHAEAAPKQMSAVATGLRMALLTSCQAVGVAHVAPDLGQVTAAEEELGRQYLPHHLTATPMDATYFEAVEQSSLSSAGRSSSQGGGGLPFTSQPSVPSNLHGCYLYICVYEHMYMQVLATPRHGQFERHVGYSAPTLQSVQWT